MSNSGMMIESVVAVLLTVTIGYCIDPQQAPAAAQGRRNVAQGDDFGTDHRDGNCRARPSADLKIAVRECDQDLGKRLRMPQSAFPPISRNSFEAGQDILGRLTRIATETRAPRVERDSPIRSRRWSRRRHFAERARTRITGYAA